MMYSSFTPTEQLFLYPILQSWDKEPSQTFLIFAAFGTDNDFDRPLLRDQSRSSIEGASHYPAPSPIAANAEGSLGASRCERNPTAIHESIQVQTNGAVSRRGESTIVEKGAQRVSPDSFGYRIDRRDRHFCANRNRRSSACRARADHLFYLFRGRLPLCRPLLR
jgi:hypothetical protein